ncbi:MAG: thiosulfate oxidation carrier protein SoxY [Betaproteobacteria bacterium]|nr:thiosulfate oxidation carrier protein SoxY [Betaproteobacteria bacterium]
MVSKRWQEQRRRILKAGGGGGVLALAFAAGLITPEEVLAQQGWNKRAFETKTFADTLKALNGAASSESKGVLINAPDIAENGMVVPVGVTSNLPKTESIAILIEKNPNTLSSVFEIADGTDPFIVTRVKMAETSNLYALVRADGKYFHAVKNVKVTLGGCGG